MFIPYCYIGFVIGTIIVCVMGGISLYLMHIAHNYEGAEGIFWLTFLLGLPFTLLMGPMFHFFNSIGIQVSSTVGVFALCLLNWSVIGYILSLLYKRQ